MAKNVTLADIAEQVGVSNVAVSKALSGKTASDLKTNGRSRIGANAEKSMKRSIPDMAEEFKTLYYW